MAFEAIIAFLVVYVALYTLISRICQCVEHCATAKAYSKFRENDVPLKMNDVEAALKY